jgi:dihydroflavonol-4-reductase
MNGVRTDFAGWRVLVTGAGGFVGGHVARELACAGYRVRAFTRRTPIIEADDPPLEWYQGDLENPDDRAKAVAGVQAVIHVAGWVSLGIDADRKGWRLNVDVTGDLLDRCAQAGVLRFVYTSSLWTVAAGTVAQPAVEESDWNLESIRSPYSESKRAAEALVLARNAPGFRTAAVCPGLVIGPRDPGPTSTALLLTLARSRVVYLPKGGIPVVDARVLARAHRLIMEGAEPGARYVVVGPYLSYRDMARLVTRITGRPRWVVPLGDRAEPFLRFGARWLDRACGGRLRDVTEAVVAGGFLALHVSGARADQCLGLDHPAPITSIYDALDDHRRRGRAPWLRLLRPPDVFEGPHSASQP